MATSNERRRVAERLRTNFVSFARDKGENASIYPLRCICALARLIGAESTDWLSINDRLADLIDPTCEWRNDGGNQTPWRCAACGCERSAVPNFCPNCGARVVSGDGY